MLIDAHAHTSGISLCSRRSAEEIIAQCLCDKTDAIVLTNHCKKEYTDNITYTVWCKKYNDEYFHTKDIGDKNGIKVLFGIEVTSAEHKNIDYLIYGITPEQLLLSPPLFDLSQEQLFLYCEKHSFLLYQAHPYRNGATPQNPKFLHGVEINCHPLYKTSEEEKVRAFAKKYNLRLSCGADFHGDTYKPRCGMFIPDDIEDSVQFAKYLKTHSPRLCVHKIIVPKV